MRTLPNSPAELQAFLVGVFPSFAADVEADEWPPEFGELTFHRVMFEFAPFFAKEVDSFSAKQLAAFGQFLQLVEATEGSLENAVSTCFLEHAHQLKVNKKLRPWLGKARRKRPDA
jgi:hypothetical protein